MMFSTDTKRSNVVMKLLLFIFIFLLATAAVTALGIKPAQQRLHYTADTVYEGQFTVIRDTPETSIAHLIPDGPLAPYISFATEYVTLEGAETVIHYTLELPAGLPPGEVTSRILVEQALTPGADGIGAKLILPFTVRVNVPYPEKFVTASLDVVTHETSIDVTTTVENKGEQAVGQVKPQISITNAAQQQVATSTVAPEALGLFEKKTFEKNIGTGKLPSGLYRATAAIAFDEDAISVVKDFSVGVAIVRVVSKEQFFKAGDVSPYTIEVQNEWNAPLTDIVASLSVKQNGREVASTKTAPFDLQLLEKRRVTAYLDARNLAPGTYDAVLKIAHEASISEYPYTIELLGSDEYAKRPTSLSANTKSWSFFGLSVLLLVNGAIALFVVMKILRKKPEMSSADQAIGEFVNKARKMGFDDANIRQQLAKTGWPSALIEKGLRK